MCDCIFCKIINKEINAYIIDEDDNALAFLDVNPVSVGHTLIIPKKHYKNFSECPIDILNAVINLTQKLANKYIKNNNLNIKGFNYISNQNKIAGQQVDHFHIHLIPRYENKNNEKIEINFNKVDINLEEIYKLLK